MVDVDARIVITYKFQKIHHVVSINLIGITLIGFVDRKQGIRQFVEYVATLHFQVCNTQLGEVKPLVDCSIKVVVVILSSK